MKNFCIIRQHDNSKFLIIGILIIFFFSHFAGLFSQQTTEKEYLKKYYSVDDGLSQSEVTAIKQDKYGFIWLGTRGGLNRFDGYDFLHFKPQPGINRGLMNPSIETLHADSQGNIWVGTKSGGLGIFSNVSNEFVELDSLNNELPNRIICFYKDREGYYWIGSWASGVYRFEPGTGQVKRYLENVRVSSVLQTQDGTIWFGTGSGLRYKKAGQEELLSHHLLPGFYEVTEMVENPDDSSLWMVGWNLGLCQFNYNTFEVSNFDFGGMPSSLLNCYSLLEDREGNLWVGTWGSGLYFRKSGLDSFTRILSETTPQGPEDRDSDIILDIFEDKAGDIWVGTDGGGVIRLTSGHQFSTLRSVSAGRIGPWHVNAVKVSPDGRLWIGTRLNGLYVTRNMVDYESVPLEQDGSLFESRKYHVKSVYSDQEGVIWVGLETGAFIVTPLTSGGSVLKNAAEVFNNSSFSGIRKVLDIKKKGDDLWIATQQNGLYWFQKSLGKYRLKRRFYMGDRTNTFKDNRISTLKFDADGNLWIGTYKGLYRMGRQDTIPVTADLYLKDNQRFLCDIILSCEIDSQNRIWVGTPCSLNGLFPDQSGKYRLKECTQKNGLTDDYVNAVIASAGFIWVSTNAGISRFDPEREVFSNYDVSDGVGGYNFAESSCAIDSQGIIYFGGYSDLTFFNPAALIESKEKPAIAITNFRVMNREVPVSKDGILPASINEVEKLRFTYTQREFSFEIAALDYKSPENNQYGYRLVDDQGQGDWVNIGQRRHISFSNLKPGNYVLFLAGSNSNGVWNHEGRRLEITILPPPWETWYAFVIYLAVLIGIVAMINKVSLNVERLKNAARIEHLNMVQEHELNESKISFFTDISHELKTPLTLILAPVEELRGREWSSMTPSFLNKRVELIHKSVSKLLGLLNQLLEFRKVETGHVRLCAVYSDLIPFVDVICKSYEDSIKEKEIAFTYDFQVKSCKIWFDPQKTDSIVNNLLSNALKYCGHPGEVHLVLSESDQEVCISVSNNGKPIAKEDIEKLFDKFYQASDRLRQASGGIGLFLVKKFVDLHKGTVRVESGPGELTVFTVCLPKGDNHLATEEKIKGATELSLKYNQLPLITGDLPEGKMRAPKAAKGARVVVVEDDAELRDYLQNLLEDQYEVITAQDGLSGFDAVMEHMPDLVVSDVMMPASDGFELCSRIRKNEKTAHIPVLLLTAKDKTADHLTAARLGADAFLAKPFDPALLLGKVGQLIASRVLLAEKYRRKVVLDPINKEITSDDEKMIKRVIGIIEKHAGNPALDSDFVAAETGMSISTFYRRMKKLVDQTPGEFIKTTRLKLAARYLKETNWTVSEIVEKIGYSDVRNFRESFKSVFNMSPGDYRKSDSV